MMRAALVVSLLTLEGCGYALVGRGGSVDPAIKRIGVPLFRDTTGRTGLNQKITQKVIEELLKRGRFDVVQEAAGVDAVVDGELTAYASKPVSFSATQQTTQVGRYQITLTARVKFTKAGAPAPLWETSALTQQDEYDVGDNPAIYEERALERLLTALAKNIVTNMFEAF